MRPLKLPFRPMGMAGISLFCIVLTGWLTRFFTPPTTIQLKLAFWGSVEEVRLLDGLITRFEQQYPGVHVQRIHIPQQYVQKLHFMAASRLLPDVVMLNSWVLPAYAQAGLLKAITLPTGFYPQALKALSWQRRLWALPRDVSDLVVYVNQDLLANHGLAPPASDWTVSQLKAYGNRLKPDWTINAPDAPPLFWLPWVWAYGGQVWGMAPNHQACLLPDNVLPGLQAFSQLRQVDKDGYSLAPSAAMVGATPMAQWFIRGKLAFLVSGRWTEPLLRQQARFRWVTVPLPAGPAGSRTGIDATGYALSAQTRYPRQAQALAQFLTNPDSLRTLSQSGLIVPARPTVAEGVLGRQSTFLQVIPKGVPTPPVSQVLVEQITENLQPAFNGTVPFSQAVATLRRYHQQLTGNRYTRCQ